MLPTAVPVLILFRLILRYYTFNDIMFSWDTTIVVSAAGSRTEHVYRIRAEYRECGKRTLYGTPLYTRRCIWIRVMCTAEHDLSHKFIVPGLDWEISRQTHNPRFGSTYRRQRVRPRRWEIYESDLFITLRLQSTFASSTKITEVTSRSNADQVPRPRLVL